MKKENLNQIVATIALKTGLRKAEIIEMLHVERSYQALNPEEAYEIYASLPEHHHDKLHFYMEFTRLRDDLIQKAASLEELAKLKKYVGMSEDNYSAQWEKLTPVVVKFESFKELIFVLCNAPAKHRSHLIAEENLVDFIDEIEKIKNPSQVEAIYRSCSTDSQAQKIMADKLARVCQKEYGRKKNLKLLNALYLKMSDRDKEDNHIRAKALLDRIEELGTEKIQGVKTQSQATRLLHNLSDKNVIQLLDKWLDLIENNSDWRKFYKAFQSAAFLLRKPEYKEARAKLDSKNNILLGRELDKISRLDLLDKLDNLAFYLNNNEACLTVSNFLIKLSRGHLPMAINVYNFFYKQKELHPWIEAIGDIILPSSRLRPECQTIFRLIVDPKLKVKAIESWLATSKKYGVKDQTVEEAGIMFQMIREYETKSEYEVQSGEIIMKIRNIKQEIIKLMQEALEPYKKPKLVSGYISKK
jgi:hypothetical protein